MSDILSQDEIEQLLNSLTGDEEEPAVTIEQPDAPPLTAIPGGAAAPASQVSYEVYDFRRPDKFSKEQLRTLQMLHETFARTAGTGLSAFLRSTVHIELISLEQVPYEEYLRSISKSVFAIMALPPLSGQAVIEIEFPLVFSMIDRLLGGPGRAIERDALTDIEAPLVRQMIERSFTALKAAWEGVVIVNPGIEDMETSAQFVQIAPPSDIVVSILFEVRVGEQRGAMSLCIPYMLLKPITAKLSAQKWFVSGNRKQSPGGRKAIVRHVQGSRVPCAVVLGRKPINVRDLLAMKPGDVLPLSQPCEDDLELTVGNTPKFVGKPATRGRQVVFHVTGPYVER